MKAQRSKWEAQLRSDIQNDDVTKQLVTSQDDREDFFKTELKKHEKLVRQTFYLLSFNLLTACSYCKKFVCLFFMNKRFKEI